MDIQALFSALKTKYPQSGLSDNEIQGLAESLYATGLVTDENVNTVVDGQADAIKKMQSLFDSRFTSKKGDFTKTLTESLEITVQRVIPFYEKVIVPQIKEGKRILVAAHGNSLRALVKYLDGLTADEIVKVNIPTGVPLVYEFDDDMNVTGKRYLGDQDAIAAKAKAVSEQAKKKA